MNYSESIAYLEKATSFGIKPGLERISALLEVLGHPEQKYRVIHITGTNGKGSTSAMVTSMLMAAGLRVGRYTSPHLVEYTERIYAMGKDISREDFAEMATEVRDAAVQVMKKGIEAPTEFELLTAMAMLYFARIHVDYAVLEVGMGGLYDSTNVITPVVSVVTNAAMDHMKYLGNTLTAIAHQKAGIIKQGIPSVTCATGEALDQIRKEAGERKSHLFVYGEDFTVEKRTPERGGQEILFNLDGKRLGPVHLPLVGVHQAWNSAAAVMAVSIAAKQDSRLTEKAMIEGLEHVSWPGRFEVHDLHGIPFIMDGAHNSAGAITLKQCLEEQFPGHRRVFVFTSLSDKDTDKVIALLMRPEDKVFITTAPTPRSRTTSEIAAMLPCESKEEPDTETALADAAREAGKDDIIVVCGSLYILGQVITWLRNQLHNPEIGKD
jgi:dihydrofolate synthase/folylpolyglutamate synthase